MDKCVMIFTSQTVSLKARRLLAEHSIACSTVKPTDEKRGCLNGVALSCKKLDEAAGILIKAGIRYSDIQRGAL